MSLKHIETNDGERRVITLDEHQKMIEKYGEDNLPYTVLTEEKPRTKRKIYGGPEPYPPGYPYKYY